VLLTHPGAAQAVAGGGVIVIGGGE